MVEKSSKKNFSGVFTAIITPFTTDESVDYPAFEKLIEEQIAAGVSGIVPCGTTGESPTLNPREHEQVIDFVIDKVRKRCLVIAGTGSNCTKEAIELSQAAEKSGADALLLVNPYYNKPTQEGLFLHFTAIASAVTIPVIVYNIKGRTGVNVETATLMRIAKECKNVIGVKEASGDINQMKDVIAKRQTGFFVLSGDDNMTLELIRNGGDGVISVASNVIPKEMVALVNAAKKKDWKVAEEMNKKLAPLFEAEFIETNPIPIKAMLALQGKCKEVYRLPMCGLSSEHKAKVKETLQKMGLLK